MEIGAQLWILSQTEPAEAEAVITQLAGAGYAFTEIMFGQPPTQRVPGLPVHSIHVALSGMPDLDALVQSANQLGATVVCVSGPLKWHERTADDYVASALALNQIGKRLATAGLGVQYHNHEFEFDGYPDGSSGWEVLVRDLDPKYVGFCFDAGWAARVGRDPVPIIAGLGARIGSLHLRDFAGSRSAPLGQGDLDLEPVIEAVRSYAPLARVLVEQDPSEDPLGCMVASRRYLTDQFGL